jgi:hypothetical protein
MWYNGNYTIGEGQMWHRHVEEWASLNNPGAEIAFKYCPICKCIPKEFLAYAEDTPAEKKEERDGQTKAKD